MLKDDLGGTGHLKVKQRTVAKNGSFQDVVHFETLVNE